MKRLTVLENSLQKKKKTLLMNLKPLMMNLFLTVKAKQRFIVLGGETFKLKWLKHWGFYRILWFGIIAKFGWIIVNKEAVNGIYISYGTANPIQELWDKNYRVRLIGKIFGVPILEYSNGA